MATSPVYASVIDIDPSGQVTVIDGPVVQMSADPRTARSIGRAGPLVRHPSQNTPTRAPTLQVREAITSAAQSARLDVGLIEAVGWQESRLRPDAVSPKGAEGVMQLMPATARSLGVQPGDVAGNVRGGATYLSLMLARYNGDLVKALAAYNAGPGAVDRHGGPPPYRETQAYVSAVLEHLAQSVVPAPSPLTTRSRP